MGIEERAVIVVSRARLGVGLVGLGRLEGDGADLLGRRRIRRSTGIYLGSQQCGGSKDGGGQNQGEAGVSHRDRIPALIHRCRVATGIATVGHRGPDPRPLMGTIRPSCGYMHSACADGNLRVWPSRSR